MKITTFNNLEEITGNEGKILLYDEAKSKIGASTETVNEIIQDQVGGDISRLDDRIDTVESNLTSATNTLSGAIALKADAAAVYTKEEVNDKFASFGGFEIAEGTGEDSHPNVDNPDVKKIYLVKKGTKKDKYCEWIWTKEEGSSENTWVLIGETTVDLSDYAKTADVNSALALKQDTLTAGTDLVIESGTIKVNTNGSAIGDYAFVEGQSTIASGSYSHAEGYHTLAYKVGSHAEGTETKASGLNSHAECYYTSALGDYSHAEGGYTLASGEDAHAEGRDTIAKEYCSHAEGCSTKANNSNSHAEGYYTTANGYASHSEGYYTSANGQASHTEGKNTSALNEACHAEGLETYAGGNYSHAEGYQTSSNGYASHTEGQYTCASGQTSHAEGSRTSAYNYCTHAEGINTLAFDKYTHSEGSGTSAISSGSHAEGILTIASGKITHAEGYYTSALCNYSHTEGYYTIAYGTTTNHAEGHYTSALGSYNHSEGSGTFAVATCTHAEGCDTRAQAPNAHAEGLETTATAPNTHTEGYKTYASSPQAHAEGNSTSAVGYHSHAEGEYTYVPGAQAHAEGNMTSALSDSTHAEGQYTMAVRGQSHAEGLSTTALGDYSHAEGYNTSAVGIGSHTEGQFTSAIGIHSHAAGSYTLASANSMTVIGTYNLTDSALFVVGNGDSSNRSDAFIVDWNGKASATKLSTSGIADIESAITSINGIPASTSADEGKVLTVDSSGDAEWAPAGGGSDVVLVNVEDYAYNTSDLFDYLVNLSNAGKTAILRYSYAMYDSDYIVGGLGSSPYPPSQIQAFSNVYADTVNILTINSNGYSCKQQYVGHLNELPDATESDLDNNTIYMDHNEVRKLTLTTISTLTVNISTVGNFALEIDNTGNSNDVTVSVVRSGTTTLKYSVAGGNVVGAGKYVQVTCVGNCWTQAEFTQPTP